MEAANDNLVQTKTCTDCGETKPVTEFHKHKSCKGGLRPNCKACRKAEAARYYAKNSNRILERNEAWRISNPEKDLDRHRRWRSANIEKSREIGRRSQQKRRLTPRGKLEAAIMNGVRISVKRGSKSGRRTFELLGYTVDDLRVHLERLFHPGMTWQNYGRGGWEIDHIIPLSAHNYETPDDIDFKKAWALSNLQPLWMPENRTKHAKLTKPFQPSLAIAA